MVTQTLNDFAWLSFVTVFSPPLAQYACIGLAVLMDKGTQTIFPRWLGFLNLWVVLLIIPSGLAVFFKTGPFAWNGLRAFWLAIAAFGSWVSVMLFYTIRALKLQAA